MRNSLILGLLLLFLTALLHVPSQAVEFTNDLQDKDRVRVTLEDGSVVKGVVEKRTEKKLHVKTDDGTLILLKNSIQDIVVLPSKENWVQLVMTDGSTNAGWWEGMDESNIYIRTDNGKIAFLKSQIDEVHIDRSKLRNPSAQKENDLSSTEKTDNGETTRQGQQTQSQGSPQVKLEQGIKFAPGVGIQAGRGPLFVFYFQRGPVAFHGDVRGGFTRERIDKNTVRVVSKEFIHAAVELHFDITNFPISSYVGVGFNRVEKDIEYEYQSTGEAAEVFSSMYLARQGSVGVEYRIKGEPIEFYGAVAYADVYESNTSTVLVDIDTSSFQGGMLLQGGVRLTFGFTK